ncbi:MAG: hypothetical protein EZS28_022925 [Streblomastix strix]|uniref:Uncharacterized protein n=1 Tax=Streblomastix strix TaxID=222440 RepID=A0A5J4VG36_9EUKA|nr:MAG: hypothetical protein EZS28_022925 [Streblomastix strix]
MPYDYIWMELPTFVSPLPSYCSFVRPTLDQFPLALSAEQKQNSLIVASESALCNAGETKLSFKSCVDPFLIPSPLIPTWLGVRWGVMRWISIRESIPAFLGLALSCSERAQRIVVPKIRSALSLPSLTIDEMFSEIQTMEEMTLTAITQSGATPNTQSLFNLKSDVCRQIQRYIINNKHNFFIFKYVNDHIWNRIDVNALK